MMLSVCAISYIVVMCVSKDSLFIMTVMIFLCLCYLLGILHNCLTLEFLLSLQISCALIEGWVR